MTNYWNAITLGLIYQIHCIAYFGLGAVALMLPKQNKTFLFARHLSLLATFAILRGIVEIIKLLPLDGLPGWLDWSDRLLLLAAFVSLLEFDRRVWSDLSGSARLSGPWLYGATGLGVGLLTQWSSSPLTGLEMGARWLVGVPAAMLTGFTLLAIPSPNTTRRNVMWLTIAAVAFICYSASTLVMSEGDPRLPAWLPTKTNFLALFGFPIHLPRALCAVTITFGFVSLIRLAGENSQVDAIVFESNEALFITDANTVILRVNDAFTQSTGYTAQEAIGRKISIMKSGRHDPAFYAAMWDSINRTGIWQGEIWDRRKNGEIYPVCLKITAVTDIDGSVIHYVGRHIDITEQKQAQQILQDKGRMLSDSQRIAHIGSWSMELDTGRVSWSDEMYRIFGITPEAFGHSSEAFLELIHPDDRAAIKIWVSDCLAGKAPKNLSFRIMLPNGAVRHLDGGGELQYDETNRPLRMVGSTQDITERKQSEQLLNQLKAMIDISLDGLWIVDLTGKLLQVNEAYARMVGYSIEELLNMRINQLDAIKEPEEIQAHIAKIISQGSDHFETRHRHKDGHTIAIEVVVAFLPAYQQFCALFKDITKRKAMEEALIASEKKFRSIIDVSPVPMALNDEQLNITLLNPAFVQTFGYTMDDIPTLADWWPKAYPDPDYRHWVQTTWQTTLEKAKQEKTGFPPMELAIRCKDNSVKTVLASAATIAQDFAGIKLVILYDITQRKQQEQRDKAHLDELSHVTRLGLMGEMASGIAHEVNQPMAAISSYTQVSLNLINTENPDLAKLSEILHKTQQQALRAGRIIHHMREFVKAHPKQIANTDPNALIHCAVDLCASEIKQNNIKLTFELGDDLPPVCVDNIQIEQVLINLIRNSVEALQNLPAKQQRQLTIQSQLISNSAIRIRVKDNGPGLDDEQKQKIAMPFYTTKTEGMGMGLSISRSLIEAHKGVFHFDSMPGKGTTFYFTLPVEKNAA